MPVTKTLSSKAEQQYIFRYEEEHDGQHGRSFIHSVPFHVTLTYPQGLVKVNCYGIKETSSIEISVSDLGALVKMLQAAQDQANQKV